MAQRISRAKQTIKASKVPFAHAERRRSAPSVLRAVLQVLYLIFNEGYTATAGATLQSHRPVERGDPSHAARTRRCCLTTPRSPGCSR